MCTLNDPPFSGGTFYYRATNPIIYRTYFFTLLLYTLCSKPSQRFNATKPTQLHRSNWYYLI